MADRATSLSIAQATHELVAGQPALAGRGQQRQEGQPPALRLHYLAV
jgi:hypothetical protein